MTIRHRRTTGGQGGFTLIEILVAVAILAILSASLTPMVIKYVNDGRRARAASDSQTIALALKSFNLDTGYWPVSSDGNTRDAGELSRLVGLAAGFTGKDIPGGSGTASGDGNWNGGGSGGKAGSLEDHLIYNKSDDVDELYATSASPPSPPGWNGPYLESIPLDPWGNPYVCNVRYLQTARVKGTTEAERNNHAVYCLSAGENLAFDTSFDDDTPLENGAGGDDIGSLLQGNRER